MIQTKQEKTPKMAEMSSIDRSRLFSLFDNMDKEHQFTGLQKSSESDVLLIDFYNLFIRSFMAIPTLNDNGLHVGGIAGFLKTIGAAIKLINPTRVVIVIDGKGGSMKRKKIYPDYKGGRTTKLRFNRSYEDLSSGEIEENGMKTQLFRTVAYLETLPLTCIAIDHVEADDVISYLALDHFKDKNIFIASCDKDFLQLVDDRIKVWSPSKKKIYGKAELHSEYGISAKNFINFRVLNGDVSDNLDGVKGAGLKTIMKCFPIFTEDKQYTIDEIFTYSENHKGKLKLYDSILEVKDIVRRNYELMQLKETQIQSFSQLRIKELLDAPVKPLNKVGFIQLITADGMKNNLPNASVWMSEVFSRLNRISK